MKSRTLGCSLVLLSLVLLLGAVSPQALAGTKEFTNSWVELADTNTGRSRPTMCQVGDTLYLIGGEDDSDGYNDVVEKYDAGLDTWTELPAVKPTGSSNLCSAAIGTEVNGKQWASTGSQIFPNLINDVSCLGI